MGLFGRGIERKYVAAGISALTLSALAGCSRQPTVEAKQDSGPIPTSVRLKQLQRDVESVGTLFPNEEVTISSEIDGRVVEVGADLGDSVKKDQTDEKDRVTDIKATPDARRAQAELTDAYQRYRRAKSLTEQGIGLRQDLDAAESHFHAAQAIYDTTLNQTRNLIREIETRAAVDYSARSCGTRPSTRRKRAT
jgi:multidrug efflux pump subunit AcrA (membrane-fusion protein)